MHWLRVYSTLYVLKFTACYDFYVQWLSAALRSLWFAHYSKVNQNCTNLRSMKLWARKQVREINEVCSNIVFIHMTICQTSIHKKTIYVRLGFCLPVKHTHKKKLLYGLYRHHLFHMVAIVSTEWVPTIFKFQW